MEPKRYCARCDQPVQKVPVASKEWTSRGEPQGEYKHVRTSEEGVSYCGRQFLSENETYLETDVI